MGSAVLSELATEIVVPVCAVVGIVFSLIQWYLVSRVKLTSERHAPGSTPKNKNGYNDHLIEEEEGLNEHGVVTKCAEIQNAISEGIKNGVVFLDLVTLFCPLVSNDVVFGFVK